MYMTVMLFLFSFFILYPFLFFFFQAEDGIRDIGVTGVQTCALPIWGGLVYPNAAKAGDDRHGAGARGARAGRESCPLRGDYATGTGGSLDIAAARGRNFSWGLRWIGAAARCHRTLCRDVVCCVAEHTRTGAAHGAWRRHIQSVAPGDVAWLDADGRRRVAWRRGGAGIDTSTRQPFVQSEPARPASLRLGIGRHDRRLARSLFLARLARDADRSSPGVAGLIPCIPIEKT